MRAFEGVVLGSSGGARRRGRVVVLGVGNALLGDDGVGPMVARMLGAGPCGSLVAIDAGEAPEAHLGKVREEEPDLVVIVDAVDFGGRPGEVVFLDPGEVGFSPWRLLSTHKIPLGLLARYIKEEVGAEVVVIGVQPRSIGFEERMSEEVRRAAEAVAEMLREISAEGHREGCR